MGAGGLEEPVAAEEGAETAGFWEAPAAEAYEGAAVAGEELGA